MMLNNLQPTTLLKMRLQHRCFFVGFVKILSESTYFTKKPLVTSLSEEIRTKQ